MNESQQKAILGICILAAMADGMQCDAEREQIQRIANGFAQEPFDLAALYQDIMMKRTGLAEFARQLDTWETKALAYEMAVCVCNADGVLAPSEKEFLAKLHEALPITEPQAKVEQEAETLGKETTQMPPPPPLNSAATEADVDRMIVNYAILNSALELMPQSIATLAIIPLQMRMVYRVGKHYGFELGRAHIRDFLGALGVGLSAQVFETFASKVVGGLAQGLGATGVLTGLSRQAANSAISFGTTYALGHVAKKYYAAGRKIEAAELKRLFTSLLEQARRIQNQYTGDITKKSQEVNPADLATLVKQN